MKGKRIIIIGASSGLGYRAAHDFAAAGWHVGAAARRSDSLRQLSAEFPDNVMWETIDVTSPDAPDALLRLIDRLGGVDIVFLAAGVGYQNPELNIEADRLTVATNCLGFVNIVDTAYRYFRDNPSVSDRRQIAVITSVAGTNGLGMAASYSASKRFESTYLNAVDQLSRIEHAGVTVTDLRPGFIMTPLLNPSRRYPMLMSVDHVAPLIMRAILKRRRVAIIDWRWRLLVGVWRLIPRWIWVRMKVHQGL